MKSKIIFCALAMVFAVLAGCSGESQSDLANIEDSNASIYVLSDSLKQHLQMQDSLSNELVLKVDSLTISLNQATNEITALKKKEKDNLLKDILPLAIGVIALIVAICVAVCIGKRVSKMNGKILKLESENKRSKEENRSSVNNYRPQNMSKSQNEEISWLKSELTRLRNDIENPKKTNTPVVTYMKVESFQTKTLYAGKNSNQYFINPTDIIQETSVFKIKLISQDKGEFDIISIDKIKQRNDFEPVVDFQGNNCLLNEANKSETIQPGLCLKRPDGLWEVVSKLKIKISK